MQFDEDVLIIKKQNKNNEDLYLKKKNSICSAQFIKFLKDYNVYICTFFTERYHIRAIKS